MVAECNAISAPDTLWSFCPSTAAAYVMAVAFGLLTIAHLVQAIMYRKAYCWVITMSATWQTIAYIFRIMSIRNPASLGDYAAWFVLILVAPLWTNAFAYMVMGRMVWNYIPNSKIFGVTAWRFGLYFVLLDITAFIVQVYGAAAAATAEQDTPQSVILRGLHIYMAGVGLQQFFVLVFVLCAFQFHRVFLRSHGSYDRRSVLWLLYTLYAVLALITLRIVFRLIEYSSGLKSTIPNHEVYQYCLDSLPMWLALLLLNIVHPGRIMPGKASDMPSRRERRRNRISSKSDRYSTPLQNRPGIAV